MTEEQATCTGSITITLKVGGSDADKVLAVASALTASAASFGATNVKATTQLTAPGLTGLPLGPTTVSGVRKDKLVRAGVLKPEHFFAKTANEIAEILTWAALREIRISLHRAGRGEHLKGDDPQRFPHLVDSLEITDKQYTWARDHGIDTIAQLLAGRTDPAVASRFGHLDRLLERHQTTFGDIEFT